MTWIYLFFLITLIPVTMGLSRIFIKAGEAGWAAWVPFYNAWIWLKVIEKPRWWFFFILLPFINVFMLLLMLVETAKTFNKNSLKEQGMAAIIPFYYLPYLGYSEKEKYQRKAERPVFKKTKIREWTDAIIFAVVAASIIRMFVFEAYTIPTPSMEKSMLVGDYLFVSKFTYGARMPNTPLALPFMHHTIPGTQMKSYFDFLHIPYYRFPAIKKVQHNDIVVFNYPDGDTVATNYQDRSYYSLVRRYGWKNVNNPNFVPGYRMPPIGKVIARPVDKRENYIKRCIGLPGDKLQIIDQQVYLNGQKAQNPKLLQYQYFITLKPGKILSRRQLEKMGIADDDIRNFTLFMQNPGYHNAMIYNYLKLSYADTLLSPEDYPRTGMLTLTSDMAGKLKNNPYVQKVNRLVFRKGAAKPDNDIFPFDTINYPWNQDNFGPIQIPKKGETIELNTKNIVLYKRIIDPYEGHQLEIKGDKILIDGQPTKEYTFAMDYYWMMGDNRHNSADSRFWGFVPEDHISGTPLFIWLSLDKDKSLSQGKIRWERTFKIPE